MHGEHRLVWLRHLEFKVLLEPPGSLPAQAEVAQTQASRGISTVHSQAVALTGLQEAGWDDVQVTPVGGWLAGEGRLRFDCDLRGVWWAPRMVAKASVEWLVILARP